MQRTVWAVARVLAFLGGAVLVCLIAMTCLSVLGRLLNGFFNGAFAQTALPGIADWALAHGVGPVLGDVELVEAGVAFAIFAFLPLCQLSGGHAKVDVFVEFLPAGARRWLLVVIDLVFAAVLCLIAWRLSEGLAEKRQYSETTFMLQFPIWWAYAASLGAAVAAAGAGVYVAGLRIVEAVTGRDVAAPDKEPAG